MKSIPNILTTLRLLACPILIYLFFFKVYLGILIIFILACLTDFFDGYIARKESLKSNFGKILDPIADKALIISMCVLLIINDDISGLHKIAFYIIILREIIITSLRFNLENQNKSIDVSPLSKYKTFIQMLAIGSIIIYKCIPYLHIFVYPGKFIGLTDVPFKDLSLFVESISYFLVWIAAFVTLITGIQHFRTYLKLK